MRSDSPSRASRERERQFVVPGGVRVRLSGGLTAPRFHNLFHPRTTPAYSVGVHFHHSLCPTGMLDYRSDGFQLQTNPERNRPPPEGGSAIWSAQLRADSRAALSTVTASEAGPDHLEIHLRAVPNVQDHTGSEDGLKSVLFGFDSIGRLRHQCGGPSSD